MVQANSSSPDSPCPGIDPGGDPVAHVAFSVTRLTKRVSSLRHRFPQERAGLDVTGFPILFTLAHGPLRVSAVAEQIFSDVSTVSRQVATLEKNGLLERTPDPADGRASLVALTAEGTDFITSLVERRKALFRQILDGWSDSDVATLADLLDRLVADIVRSSDEMHGHPTAKGTTP